MRPGLSAEAIEPRSIAHASWGSGGISGPPNRKSIIRAVATVAGRRIAIVVVLLLLAGAAVLVALPHRVAAIRFGPLSLLWWYGAVAAPLIATLVTTVALVVRPARAHRDEGRPDP
jgi:hypothetical protein